MTEVSKVNTFKIKYMTPIKIKVESFITIEKLFLKKTPTIKARQIPRNSVISGIIKIIFSIFIYLSNLLLAHFDDFGLYR